MKNGFLLASSLAERLFFEKAKDMPIIDPHNHLNAADIKADRQFDDIVDLWLISDPYKSRALRIMGVDERLITGDAPKEEKFRAWAQNLPKLAGNPLYQWSQMELSRVFDIDEPLNEKNCDDIRCEINNKLKNLSAQKILSNFKIVYSAPCVGFCDDISSFDGSLKLYPSLRGDELLNNTKSLVEKLNEKYDIGIESRNDLYFALKKEIEELYSVGCRYLDFALDAGFAYKSASEFDEKNFALAISEKNESFDKSALFSDMLRLAFKIACEYDMVVQLHVGASRYTSARLRKLVGPAGGFAAISNTPIDDIIRLLSELENSESLTRTVIYPLNPEDYAKVAILSGSFNKVGETGYVQLGAAWWWCDHIDGMRSMLDKTMCYGVLSAFSGMTTDSRSLLSFSRHEYFRRFLCDYVAKKVETGELPDDYDILSQIVGSICFDNAKIILNKRGIVL